MNKYYHENRRGEVTGINSDTELPLYDQRRNQPVDRRGRSITSAVPDRDGSPTE